jgi:hypothetical protein
MQRICLTTDSVRAVDSGWQPIFAEASRCRSTGDYELLGPVASTPTAWRVVERIGEGI